MEACSVEGVCNQRNDESNINLDCFWDLAETNRQVRLRAAERLLNSLSKSRKEEVLSSDLDYSIDRLIKGLGSSRKAARQGFALVLTQILRIFTEVPLDDILKRIGNHLSPTGTTGSKNDTKSNSIGRTLAFGAVIHSGRLKDHPDCVSETVIALLSLYRKQNYIQQVIQRLLSELFNQLTSESFVQHVWQHLKKDLKNGWEDCTPNNLWLLFASSQSFPDVVNSKFLKKYWNAADILDKENFVHIAKIMKQSTATHPYVHPVCTEIIKWCLEKEDFGEFWRVVIDENLFVSGQGEKLYLGYELVKMALPSLKHQKQVQSVLLPNFCQAFMRCSLNQHHSLNTSASHMGDCLAKFVSEAENPNVQIAVVEIFLKPPGTLLFDKITKKKTFANIVSYLKADAVKLYAEMLKAIFFGKEEENNNTPIEKRKSFALHQLSVLVGHPAMVSNNAWRKEVVQFLLLHSFFIIKKYHAKIPQSSEKPIEISDSLREDCCASFTRALEFMLKSGTQKPQTEEKCDLMVGLLEFTDHLLNLHGNFIFLADFSQIKESWNSVLSVVKKLQKLQKKDGKVQETCSFQIIFIHLALQLLIDPQQASVILKELEECCKRALKISHHGNKKLQTETISEENTSEPQWIEVVVELLLSLLSQPSHLARIIVTSAFPYFCPFLTSTTLDQIMNVINPKECPGEELMGGEDDEASFESGSSDNEEENEDDTVNEELRKRVKLALGQEGDDDSEQYLSDSEMFALDDALSAAFANQKSVSHKKPTKEDIELLHFRLRCLDLLFTFLKSGPPLTQVIRLISPLLCTLEYSLNHKHHSSLVEKIKNLLQIIIKHKKWPDTTGVKQEELKALLLFLMSKAKKAATDVQMQKILIQLCTYVVLCSKRLYKNNKKNDPNPKDDCSQHWYVEDYKLLLKIFLESSTIGIHPEMFISLLTIHPEVAWEFVELLLAYAFQDNIRLYKRTQILGILLAAIKTTEASSTLKSDEWKKFCSNLIPPVIKALQDLINSQNVKTTYTIEILDILATVAKISAQYNMNVLQNYEDIRNLQNLSRKQRQKLQKRGRQLWRKVLNSIGLQS